MGQFAHAFQPGLALAPIAQRELFFDSLSNELAQWYSQRTGGGLGLTKGRVRDLQGGLHDASIPCLWDSRSCGFVRTRQILEAVQVCLPSLDTFRTFATQLAH